MSPDKLVMMANQIGKFFAPQRKTDPVADILDHIEKFWDPSMRAAIVAHLEAGGAGLDPPVREAVARLQAKGRVLQQAS
ncbi:formate dehydrogenase subunit delta [Ferrovibrio xuzhouensis]|uniref:Formate dehydrogenase subunit delta n=1 Tax=Ferrovibrio xuzhouensis TaxID=1576914 RepID=A0ABV7VFB5_9PROT